MYEYKVDHIPRNTPYNRRPCLAMMPEYITIHSTGNTASAKNERAYLTNPKNERTASYHIVIDDKEAIECVPLNEVTWNAGDGKNGSGNRKSISIEISEGGNRVQTIKNAVHLTAKLLYERKWGIDKLRRHYDWSGKICPRIMSNNNWQGWNDFKISVQKELDKLNNANKVRVNINGQVHFIDGFLKDGTNYCSIRQIAEILGKKVEWDNVSKTVVIK